MYGRGENNVVDAGKLKDIRDFHGVEILKTGGRLGVSNAAEMNVLGTTRKTTTRGARRRENGIAKIENARCGVYVRIVKSIPAKYKFNT